jgi:hypothetical protein
MAKGKVEHQASEAAVEAVEAVAQKEYKNPSELTKIVIIKTGENMTEGEEFEVGIQVADILVSKGIAKIL